MKPAPKFMKDLFSLAKTTSQFSINPDDDEELVVDDCIAVEMEPIDDNWVHFLSIRALDPGKGTGTAAMKKIFQLVDDSKVNLIGKVRPYDSGHLGKESLRKWYRKFGCHPLHENNPDGIWVRVLNSSAVDLDSATKFRIHQGLSGEDLQERFNFYKIIAIGVIVVLACIYKRVYI